MFHYGTITLVYIGQSKDEKGSPIELTQEKEVKTTETKTFSLNYYTSNGVLQRSMRNSRNFVVAKHLCDDIVVDDVKYELAYVKLNDITYHIRNILNYRKSGLRMLLDVEELK